MHFWGWYDHPELFPEPERTHWNEWKQGFLEAHYDEFLVPCQGVVVLALVKDAGPKANMKPTIQCIFLKSQGVMMQASNICIHVGNCRYRITICKHLLGLLYFLWWFCFASCGYMRGWLMVKVVGLLSYKTGYQVAENAWNLTLRMAMSRVHIPVPRCPREPDDGVISWDIHGTTPRN